MTFCTCTTGSKGCYICNPNDFDNINGTMIRKVKTMPGGLAGGGRACSCSDTRPAPTSASPTRKISQIDEQLQIMDKNIKDLNEIVMNFGLCINRILRNEPKEPSGNETCTTPVTPLANELALKNRGIEAAISHLNWYIERVELEDDIR
jgi:hypothetical protein